MTIRTEGWQQPNSNTKWHYFGSDRRSLCGSWMTLSRDFETGNDGSPDNCARCRAWLAAERARTANSVGTQSRSDGVTQ